MLNNYNESIDQLSKWCIVESSQTTNETRGLNMPLQNETILADIIGGVITGLIAGIPFVLYFVGVL